MEKEILNILVYNTSKSVGNPQRNTIAQQACQKKTNLADLDHLSKN